MVNIQYFFKSPNKFPWEVMGLSHPKLGSMCGIICRIIAQYASPEWKYYYAQGPSLSELKRHFEHYQESSPAEDIIRHCEREKYDSTAPVAAGVLDFLSSFPPFCNDFQQKMDALYFAGRIKIPEEAKQSAKKTSDDFYPYPY
jgi:hypothetical protein